MTSTNQFYAESLLFQSPHPSQLPFPVFDHAYTLALYLHPDNTYSIHGLWSKVTDDYCHKEFNAQELGPIIDRLQQHWFDKNNDNLQFWQHEYERHGSCLPLTELEYFSKALDLFDLAMSKGPKWLEQWGSTFKIPIDTDWNFLAFQLV